MKGLRANKTLVIIILISCLFIGARCPPKPDTKTALRIRSLVSVPRSEQEFASIFGSRATRAQLNSVLRNREIFARAGTELLNSRQHLLNSLKDDASGIVLLAGHNVEGNLMFPDGSYVSFEEINNVTKVNRIVVLISCNSNEFASQGQIGVSREITYDEASIIVNRMSTSLNIRSDLDVSNNYQYSVSEVERMLQDADLRANVDYTVRKLDPYIAGGVGGGALITYFIVEPQITDRNADK